MRKAINIETPNNSDYMANDKKDGLDLDKRGIDELRYIHQLYENQYAMIGNSINMHLRELQGLNAAQQTLENMNIVEGKETLTEIGGGLYLQSKVHDPKSVIVNVGGGYLVEKEIDAAKGHVAGLIKSYTDNLNRLTKSRKEVESALIEINYKIGEKSR